MADISDLISREEAAKRLEALAEKKKGSFSGEAFEFAAKVVRGVPAAVRWIPVTERLPEEYTTILVCGEDGVEPGNFSSKSGFWTCDAYEADLIMGVTHWMPLPEPPKGE